MKNKLILIILFVLTSCVCIIGKNTAQGKMSDLLFDTHVKTLSQFADRFNGLEFYPLLEEKDSGKITSTKYTLFDSEILNNSSENSDSIMKLIKEFVETAENQNCKFFLEDSLVTLKADCNFSMDNTIIPLSLFFRLEEYEHNLFRWALFDINGLITDTLSSSDGVFVISPVSHELNFMELEDVFVFNPNSAPYIKSKNKKLDELSFFMGLIKSGTLKYQACNEICIICHSVPGFEFIVREIPRINTSNSGWLITNLYKTTNK